jgi:hypothetical protein
VNSDVCRCPGTIPLPCFWRRLGFRVAAPLIMSSSPTSSVASTSSCTLKLLSTGEHVQHPGNGVQEKIADEYGSFGTLLTTFM